MLWQLSIYENESEVAQSCLTLWDLMDCSLSGSSVYGIFQARVLEWVAISFSRGSSWPRDWNWVSHIAGRCFTISATREAWTPSGEGNGNPLQYSCLENSMDREAWRATVHGVTKSQTRPSYFTHSLTFCHKGGVICISEVIEYAKLQYKEELRLKMD